MMAKNIFSILRLNKALMCFSPMNKMEMKNNRMTSFPNDPQGVSLIASPKQPQSVTLL